MSERSFQPNYVVPPGETLEEVLLDRKMTPVGFAEQIDVPIEIIAGILKGETPISDEIAYKFHDYLGISTSFWIRLEKNYRDGLARGAEVL